jgi:beta-glucanase (GH16 family)
MKKQFSLKPAAHTAAVIAAIALSAFADPPTSSTWRMTFDDEFDGTSLDQTKWNPCPWSSSANGRELQGYDAAHGVVADGYLHQICEKKTNTFGGATRTYLSSIITTQNGKFSQRFGYFEARIKPPRTDGMWPAFWTIPADGWPPEADIFELINSGNFGTGSYGTCWFSPSNYPSSCGGVRNKVWQAGGDPRINITSNFHMYGMEWSDTYIKFYFDGAQVGQPVTADCAPTSPHYLILNLAVDHDAAGAGIVLPCTLKVDWVRAYERTGASGVYPAKKPVMAEKSSGKFAFFDLAGRPVNKIAGNKLDRLNRQGVYAAVPYAGKADARECRPMLIVR